MNREEIKKWMLESSGFPVTQANAEYLERFQAIAFQAGAASRDAEVAKLINAVADHVTARIELRAQINVLREAVKVVEADSEEVLDFDECTAMCIPMDTYHGLIEAAEATCEQSLAEYRNKVIEDCAAVCDVHANGWEANPGNNPEAGFIASSNCAYNIRELKEQP